MSLSLSILLSITVTHGLRPVSSQIDCSPATSVFLRWSEQLEIVLSFFSEHYKCFIKEKKHTWNKQDVREAATIFPRSLQVDLWLFDLESGVRVTCDVSYLCANFSLPRPLLSRLRPDVRDRQTDRQTDVRPAASLSAPYLGAWA